MTLYDEINMLMMRLTEMWGSVAIACDNDSCQVSDGDFRVYEAKTLLEALRAAVDEQEAASP